MSFPETPLWDEQDGAWVGAHLAGVQGAGLWLGRHEFLAVDGRGDPPLESRCSPAGGEAGALRDTSRVTRGPARPVGWGLSPDPLSAMGTEHPDTLRDRPSTLPKLRHHLMSPLSELTVRP